MHLPESLLGICSEIGSNHPSGLNNDVKQINDSSLEHHSNDRWNRFCDRTKQMVYKLTEHRERTREQGGVKGHRRLKYLVARTPIDRWIPVRSVYGPGVKTFAIELSRQVDLGLFSERPEGSR